MGEAQTKKDNWDKLSSLTPLILGIAISGVGAAFTNVYNTRQLQLNQIAALDKLRPMLTSSKPEERQFAYASFAVLGYEKMAVQIISINRDQAGVPVLLNVQQTASQENKSSATIVLKELVQARKLVALEQGGYEIQESANPNHYEQWSMEMGQQLGIESPLGLAILDDSATNEGPAAGERFAKYASDKVHPPINSKDMEKAWLSAFLDARHQHYVRIVDAHPTLAEYLPGWLNHTEKLREYVNHDDFDLKAVDKVKKTGKTKCFKDSSGTHCYEQVSNSETVPAINH